MFELPEFITLTKQINEVLPGKVIQQGALATRSSGISPWITQWLPLGLLAAFAFWRFYSASFLLGSDGLDRVPIPIQEFTSRMTTRLLALVGIRRENA